jgi:hypothetical protein
MEETTITVRNVDVVLTKISIQPGDVLVVSSDQRLRQEQHANIVRTFSESFGCPVCLLDSGLKLEAVLSISQECLELAAAERNKRAEECFAALTKLKDRFGENK